MNVSDKKIKSYFRRVDAIRHDSHDKETKVGAILVHGESGATIAEGYNGFVRGAPDHLLPNIRPDKYKYMQHAEMNLLCNAARHGISTNNCFVVCTLSPCTSCIRMLYQAGISTIIYREAYCDINESINMGDLNITTRVVDNKYSIMTVSPYPH